MSAVKGATAGAGLALEFLGFLISHDQFRQGDVEVSNALRLLAVDELFQRLIGHLEHLDSERGDRRHDTGVGYCKACAKEI